VSAVLVDGRHCPSIQLRASSSYDSLEFAKTTRDPIMAWTGIMRTKYRRDGLRDASDTTDE
jgi:hypothetical protein